MNKTSDLIDNLDTKNILSAMKTAIERREVTRKLLEEFDNMAWDTIEIQRHKNADRQELKRAYNLFFRVLFAKVVTKDDLNKIKHIEQAISKLSKIETSQCYLGRTALLTKKVLVQFLDEHKLIYMTKGQHQKLKNDLIIILRKNVNDDSKSILKNLLKFAPIYSKELDIPLNPDFKNSRCIDLMFDSVRKNSTVKKECTKVVSKHGIRKWTQ